MAFVVATRIAFTVFAVARSRETRCSTREPGQDWSPTIQNDDRPTGSPNNPRDRAFTEGYDGPLSFRVSWIVGVVVADRSSVRHRNYLFGS